MVIATATAGIFLVLLALDLLGYLANPYIGLILFIGIPALFVAGLLLIAIGVRRARHQAPDVVHDWPVLDLRDPQQRSVIVAVLALTFINVLIVSVAAYGGVHYMETTAFCGTVCHTTMEPEYVAHQHGPHAQIECVQCHVGPGAGALAQSKLAGTRQLFEVITNRVPRPVPPPPQLIRPARATCEGCHWPERFIGDRTRVIREFGNDEKNSQSDTTIQLHVGGGNRALGVGM